MLALLLSFIALLAVLFVVIGADASGLDQMSGGAIALGVVAALAILYLVTLRGHSADALTSRWRKAAIGAGLLAVGLALYFVAPQSLTSSLHPSAWRARPEPPIAGTPQPAAVRIRKTEDGRFVARCDANGFAIAMVVDSGSAAVVLKASDAEQAGIDVSALSFDIPLATANGQTYVAPARIRSLAVGEIRQQDVEAFVAKPGSLNENLLGMSFLRRLASYEIRGDFMTLRQ